jgi:hypothetical protein
MIMEDRNSPQSQYQGESCDTTVNPPMSPASKNLNHSRDVKFQLPLDFTPSPYSVLVGRGKVCTEATGNKRLKVLVSTFLDEYSKKSKRVEKSVTVSKIIDMVREACPVGAFIKREKGIWWEVSDCVARERVGAILRDSLHEQYRSSSKSSSEDTGLEPETATRNKKATHRVSMVSSSGEVPLQSYSQDMDDQIYSPYQSNQGSSLTSIVNHPPLDDDTLARIDAADVLLRKLPKQSSVGQSFLKEKTETSYHLIDKMGSLRDEACSSLYRDPTWHGSTSSNSFPDDPFQVLAQQQQLVELQLQENRQQQLMYHQQQQKQLQQQQQQQHLLYLQQQRQSSHDANCFGHSSSRSYMPNMMSVNMTFQRPSVLQDSSSHDYHQMGVLDPTWTVPSRSLDAVAPAIARLEDHANDNDMSLRSLEPFDK